ncbi:hypothetical protein BDW66DRAFT_145309 [Aspergillus desertorum]
MIQILTWSLGYQRHPTTPMSTAGTKILLWRTISFNAIRPFSSQPLCRFTAADTPRCPNQTVETNLVMNLNSRSLASTRLRSIIMAQELVPNSGFFLHPRRSLMKQLSLDFQLLRIGIQLQIHLNLTKISEFKGPKLPCLKMATAMIMKQYARIRELILKDIPLLLHDRSSRLSWGSFCGPQEAIVGATHRFKS